MTLYDKNLPKNPGEQFKNIEEKINSATTSNDVADMIAKYREEMISVLKSNEAEGTEDETKLNKLRDRLEEKKRILETGLGTMGSLNLTNNDDIVDFWKGIVDGSKLTGHPKADDTEKQDLNNTIIELLKKIQFLHDNGNGNQTKDFTLFKGKSTDITNFKKTLKNPLIKDLLDQTNSTKVKKNVDTFINSMKHSNGNAFYIRISDKLFDDEQGKIAMRITLYLYCLKKLIEDDKLTKDIYNESKNILENQIKNEEIPRIKGLHNTKKELGYITPEYETLRDLNVNAGDVNLGSKDLTVGFTETQDLTAKFENGTATGIEKYEIDKNLIKVSDADGNALNVSLSEPSGRDLDILFSNINDGEKFANIHINIGGTDIKIGQLILDNTEGAAKLYIKLDDFTTLSGRATTTGVTLPNLPFSLDLPVKGIKNIKNGLHGCKASLTRHYKATLVTTGGVVPPIPIPSTTVDDLEIDAVVSDMGTDVLREKVALDVEEELKKEYKEINKGNVFKRAYFFLGRGKIRNKRIKNKLGEMSGKAFTGDSVIDDQTGNAADRHQLEKETGFNADIKNIDEAAPVVYQSPQINDLCKRYLEGSVTDNQFQTEFNTIIESDTFLKDELKKANVNHMGTNILLRMKQQLAWKTMINVVKTNFDSYVSSGASSYIDNVNVAIKDYIKTFQDNTDRKHGGINKNLLTIYNDYLGDKTNTLKLNELQNFLMHEQAVMSLTASNIKIKLDIIKGGKSAYQIDNKEREKSWKYKLGHWMDKHPVRTSVGTVGASIGLGLATGGLGAVAGAAVTTAGFASIVGTTNAVKKWTHHTKEQNTHEKNLVTDNIQEKNRIKNWEDMKNNNGWWTWKHYKAKRQLELYNETTQSDIKISNIISNDINNNVSSLVGNLTTAQEATIKNQLRGSLIEGWARLKYYKEIGHNFLASNQRTKTEEDMNQLSKALLLGIKALGDTDFSDIESYSATNSIGRTITFNDVYDNIKDNFKNSDKEFRKRRRNLSLKYGISTGLASAGTALGMQWLTGTGVFAKGTNPVAGYSNSSHITDNFDLGKHQLLDTGTQNNIYNGTKGTIVGAPEEATLNIHYGAGTDATGFLPGRTPTATNLASKVSEVTSNINGMPGLTSADKATFINEVSGLGGGTGTNGVLQNMRQAEFLEQAARALSDSGMSGKVNLSLVHDASGLDIVGTHVHDVGERVVNGFVEVTKAGTPGKPPVKWGRWLMGTPFFFNTFKDKQEP